ncbi:hypothetical protein RN001_006790 [Aquatica leii]|uniref:Uncharacterized protein n=1 Tax=Aquatica leii TaxID=1421715 RepID=A0AAN7SBN2_9COLE|nr:hypothetical protein RN001_006790 [Aquatica leii]
MVFPRKNFKHHMLNGAPPGTLGLATPSGWINGEFFPSQLKWIQRYLKFSNRIKISKKNYPKILRRWKKIRRKLKKNCRKLPEKWKKILEV